MSKGIRQANYENHCFPSIKKIKKKCRKNGSTDKKTSLMLSSKCEPEWTKRNGDKSDHESD